MILAVLIIIYLGELHMPAQETDNQKPCDVFIQHSLIESLYKATPSLSCPESYELKQSWFDAIRCSTTTECSGNIVLGGPLNSIKDTVHSVGEFIKYITCSATKEPILGSAVAGGIAGWVLLSATPSNFIYGEITGVIVGELIQLANDYGYHLFDCP